MKNLTRWQRPELASFPPFGRLFGLRDELDHLFHAAFEPLAPSLLNGWNPAIDLYEDKDNVYVKAELAGMQKEDITVHMHDGLLTVSGERKSDKKFENAETHRSERFVGRFHRTISLPGAVKSDKVQAQYKDGILTITLPKAEEAKPKQIEISAS